MLSKKFLTIFLSVFLLLDLVTVSTHAQTTSSANSFKTKLHTTVTVQNSGQARIKHQFEVTNKTPTTYISQYGLKISSSQLSNYSVISNGQVLKPDIVTISAKDKSGPGQTSIGLTFPDKVVGEGQTRKFSISYTHPDAATINGSVLEVTLPPQANLQDYDQYTVTLLTPSQFGGPVRTTPKNHTFTASGQQIISNFNQGGEKGIFALFGQEQFFALDLEYYLDNPSNNPGITQIALPPDTTYQKVFYQNLEPKPKKMALDSDGNWIATYRVPAGDETVVKLQATAKLTLEPNLEIPIIKPNEALLKTREFLPVSQPKIESLAQEHQAATQINDYVVSTLEYSTQRALNRPERLGALTALAQPEQAVCQEYTDLFITIARAANIPARRVTGYAQTQNSELRPLSLVEDVLHAWPEYYNAQEKQWVPIDPTWEDTTGGVDYFNQLDLNHLVFAINGQNSSTPHPAGSYKNIDHAEKTVHVEFAKSLPTADFKPKIELKPRQFLGINLPGFYNLELSNPTGAAQYNLPLSVKLDHSHLVDSSLPTQIETLLPFQTLTFPLWLESDSSYWPQNDTMNLKLDHEQKTLTINTSPKLSPLLNQPRFALAVAGGLIGSTLLAGSLLVFRKKR